MEIDEPKQHFALTTDEISGDFLRKTNWTTKVCKGVYDLRKKN